MRPGYCEHVHRRFWSRHAGNVPRALPRVQKHNINVLGHDHNNHHHHHHYRHHHHHRHHLDGSTVQRKAGPQLLWRAGYIRTAVQRANIGASGCGPQRLPGPLRQLQFTSATRQVQRRARSPELQPGFSRALFQARGELMDPSKLSRKMRLVHVYHNNVIGHIDYNIVIRGNLPRSTRPRSLRHEPEVPVSVPTWHRQRHRPGTAPGVPRAVRNLPAHCDVHQG